MRFAVAVLSLGLLVGAARAESPDSSGAEKLGWKLALQSWSGNFAPDSEHTVMRSLEYAKKLGIHYLEVFPGQKLGGKEKGSFGPDMSEAEQKFILDAAKDADVKIIDTGVIGLPSDEAGSRKVFDWAKKMGITTIVSEPEEKALPMIDKLAGEYGINVALHDHPKPSRYWDPEYTYDHIKDLKHVGFCADVGHWKRSGLIPADVLEKYGDKVFSSHFKDLVKDGGGMHDVPWGTGESRAADMLAALKKHNFKGPIAIEYEYHWDVPTLQKCVDFFNETANKLAK